MVGGNGNVKLGLHQVNLFLSLLRGPNGEKVKSKRVGTFLYFSERDPLGEGEPCPCEVMGDFYNITYRGLATPLQLAITLYDYDNPRIPKGLTLDEKEIKKLLQSAGMTPRKE